MKIKPIYIVSLIFIITLFISNFIFDLFIRIAPFIIFLSPLLYLLKKKKKKKKLESESILEKRIKRFKTIKRGYYSLIILIVFYAISLISPLWMNNKPLFLKYDDKYYFPAARDFFDFIPGVEPPFYEANTFNQNTSGISANFRLLDKQIKKEDSNNYIVMPIYIYHPHEDLKDELDEEFNDSNNNGQYDLGEVFADDNGDGLWTENNPPTLPSGKHIAGTDNTGRDVFARLIDGYKISITFAVVVTTLSYIIGVIIGACLGYFGGRLDLFGLRLIEIFSSIPFLFMLMILGSFMKPGVFLLALLSVLLKGWIGITWYIRGEFFREKPKDYVSAAVSMGQSNWKIMFKHILPNSLTPIITFAPFAIIGDIFTLVSLDFLGYGLKPPASSWGNLLQQGAENLDYWHMLIFPVIALTVTIFMITFISEAIREAFDPRVYSRLR
ncbi:MAG: peptide ABC transporter permease [Candidatus Marinimicrobia bacterium]|nr:peptide ABC transporter permease [Candidatus Neomarinimicrobiota bacterium]